MLAGQTGRHRATLGADKGYDAADFVAAVRALNVTPHIAQNTSRRSAIDGRTTRHPGYAPSQRTRKRIEEAFGWIKTTGGLRKTRHRGTARDRKRYTALPSRDIGKRKACAGAGVGTRRGAAREDGKKRHGGRRMHAPESDQSWVDPTWTRLEDQIEWYDLKGTHAQRSYKRLKVIQVVLAALIPFLAGFQDNLAALLAAPDLALLPPVAIALLGVGVVVVEGLEHLNQYHRNWLGYRATCEALKHEKFLFLADAGPYGDTEDKRALLAERIEELIGKEHAQWVAVRARSRDRGAA